MELTNGTILTNEKVLNINHKTFKKTFMRRLALAQTTISTTYTTMDKIKFKVLKIAKDLLYASCIIFIALLAYI